MMEFDPAYFIEQVERAGQCEPALAEVGKIYDELAVEIAREKPVCTISGRCCKFEEYGHRLYVTTVELGAFMSGLDEAGRQKMNTWSGTGCPFQVAKLCTVHRIRPFGCRMFFCDPNATEWQNRCYETTHRQLKDLHDRHEIAYFYMEWRQALRILLG